MTIYDAIMSGKAFRRPGSPKREFNGEALWWASDFFAGNFSRDDLAATDWQIKICDEHNINTNDCDITTICMHCLNKGLS